MTGRKLLWVHQNFVTRRQAGNSRPAYIIAALLEAGWTVDVICSQRSYLGDPAGVPGDEIALDREGKLTIHRLPSRDIRTGSRRARRAREYFDFASAAMCHARGMTPSMIYCSSPPLPQALVSVALALRHRVPLMLEVRDLWPAFLIEGKLLKSKPVIAAMHWLEALLYRGASRVVAVSPGFEPYLSNMGVPGERLDIVPTGAAQSATDQPTARMLRQALGVEGQVVLLYAGSFNEAYDIPTLLAAARLTAADGAPITWLFAGNGQDRPLVEHAVGTCPNVRYLGSLPKDALTPFLEVADAGIATHAPWPLLQTTVTGKLFDYLSASLPVIALSAGFIENQLARSGIALQVSPQQPEALAAAACEFASRSPDLRKAAGRAGHEWVQKHYDGATLARQMAHVVALAERDGLTGRRRWATAALAAVADTVGGRSRRVLSRHYGDEAMIAATVARAFTQWESRPTAPFDPRPLQLPRLISDPTAPPPLTFPCPSLP